MVWLPDSQGGGEGGRSIASFRESAQADSSWSQDTSVLCTQLDPNYNFDSTLIESFPSLTDLVPYFPVAEQRQKQASKS